MSQCPVCQTQIADAFGIIQCPKCETMLVAEFDGALKVHTESPEVDVNANIEIAQKEDSHSEGFGVFESSSAGASLDTPVIASTFDGEEFESFTSEPEVASHIEVEDIRQFGESDDSRLSEGELLYTLIFAEVDTQDLKDEILGALKDKRLAIEEASQIKIQNDSIYVLKLNPVKVSVLTNKLKSLPVHISWKQDSLLR